MSQAFFCIQTSVFSGLRSLAAGAGREPTSFHGADGADALQLQGIGQQWRPLLVAALSECLVVAFAAMCHTRRRGIFAPRRFERAGPATTPFFPSRPLCPWRDAVCADRARRRGSQGMESDSIWGGPELSAIRVESTW